MKRIHWIPNNKYPAFIACTGDLFYISYISSKNAVTDIEKVTCLQCIKCLSKKLKLAYKEKHRLLTNENQRRIVEKIIES